MRLGDYARVFEIFDGNDEEALGRGAPPLGRAQTVRTIHYLLAADG